MLRKFIYEEGTFQFMERLSSIIMGAFLALSSVGCEPLPVPECLEPDEIEQHTLTEIIDLPIVIHVSSDDFYGTGQEIDYFEENFRGEFNGLWIPLALRSGPGEARFMFTNAAPDESLVRVREGTCEDTTIAYTEVHGTEHLPHVIGAINLYFCSDVSGKMIYSPILDEMASFKGYVPKIGSNYVFLGSKDPYVVLHETLIHALGLFHTHETRYGDDGDLISDTNYDQGPGACNAIWLGGPDTILYDCGKDSNGDSIIPPVYNLASYHPQLERVETETGNIYFTKRMSRYQIKGAVCGAKEKGWIGRLADRIGR